MAINLNGTTPAAPAGGTNVQWQSDISGNVTAYVNSPETIPTSDIDLTAQAANIAPANLVPTPTAGVYRITATIIVTQEASSTSTLPSVVITWQDQNNAATQTLTLTATSSGNLLTTFESAVTAISANTAAIQYSTTGYASSGGTSMQYALHIRIEAL